MKLDHLFLVLAGLGIGLELISVIDSHMELRSLVCGFLAILCLAPVIVRVIIWMMDRCSSDDLHQGTTDTYVRRRQRVSTEW